tara:strand:+ start:187 stop:522 length:336 start_codon:yes stop_codon:yes gene_type:complete
MTWKNDALQHAKDCLPNESCGLVIKVDGKMQYKCCENISSKPELSFVINPLQWAEIEDSGDELIAVVHSHPEGDIKPSDTDLKSCNDLGLDFYICSPTRGDWYNFSPTSTS